MAFCSKCRAALNDGARFCGKCGAQVIAPAAPAAPAAPSMAPEPAPMMAPAAAPAAPSCQAGAATVPVVPGYDFSRIPLRRMCRNGHLKDVPEGTPACPVCGDPYGPCGLIQIYRMGAFTGMAVGMGVYVNDAPFGHLGNKQSIRLALPFGQYKLHMTHTTTRACNDPIITLTPQTPYVFCKAHFAAAGFRIGIDPAAPDTMPVM